MKCLAQKVCPAKAKGRQPFNNPMGNLETGVYDKGRGRCSKGHSALFFFVNPIPKVPSAKRANCSAGGLGKKKRGNWRPFASEKNLFY